MRLRIPTGVTAMADRPMNYCRDCVAQWYPRGTAPQRCPGCGGRNIDTVLSLDDAEPEVPPEPEALSICRAAQLYLVAPAALYVVALLVAL